MPRLLELACEDVITIINGNKGECVVEEEILSAIRYVDVKDFLDYDVHSIRVAKTNNYDCVLEITFFKYNGGKK